MKNYEKLDILSFGKHLIISKDLDPVYVALRKLYNLGSFDKEKYNQLCRWLIAYWCFYHCGFASYASEKDGKEFWETLMIAAKNETLAPTGTRWPRGHERRHARGAQGIKMIEHLSYYGEQPQSMVSSIIYQAPSYEKTAEQIQTHTLFGPWISFKICDMIDRVLNIRMDFTQAAVFMFKDPIKAALILWRQQLKLPENAKPLSEKETINGVVNYLTEQFKSHLAPPLFDRPIGLQEIETILCKWKSHLNGHYPLNNDILEISAALNEWAPYSETAKKMLSYMPTVLPNNPPQGEISL